MKAKETLYSRVYSFFNSLDWAKRTLLISISQAIILGVLEIFILTGTLKGINLMFGERAGSAGYIIVYFVLFIIANVFSALMAADAWVAKNTMQAVAVAVFNFFSCIYSIVQIFHLKKVLNCGRDYLVPGVGGSLELAFKLSQQSPECPKTDAFELNGPPGFFKTEGRSTFLESSVSNLDQGIERIQGGVDIINGLIPIAGFIAALTLLYSLIGVMTSFKVYQEYGWSLIQKNGASLQKKNILQRYHAYILLLKLNIFFSCGIIIQMVGALYYYNKQASMDMAISKNVSKYFVAGACVIMCIVAIIFYTVGYYGVKKSSYSLMGVFLLLMVGNGIALISAIVIASTEPAYKLTIIWLTSFSVVQILVIFATIAAAIVVMLDLKDGELYKILNPSSEDHKTKQAPMRLVLD